MGVSGMGFLTLSVCCHFFVGSRIFPDVKKSTMTLASLMLFFAGVSSGYKIFTANFCIILMLLACVIRWVKGKKRLKEIDNIGMLYVNLSFMPFLVFMIGGMNY
ncbi:hypothetical protein [Serratia fonticola]|uniref:hypothetical protein n=1 Tax=Serratia fonticola TaxID=47917 RepID=UPI0027FD440E|nr:hypothetical protein [Serratia fonticola]MDQ7207537.1 hypothetical protein [Serratia fonticola]HBE9077771.1 hypothetical protein [Serratia fonticola]HBE9088342.1 hypothetical protein [Serratia fonticola]HBE9150500.1 hypothetical protein [Serratia fonticola]